MDSQQEQPPRPMGPGKGPWLLGCACFLVASTCMLSGAGDGAWLCWLVALAVAGFLCGRWWPRQFGRAVLTLMAVQPLGIVAVTVLSGEATHPSRSTGGLAGACIGSMLILMSIPLPWVLAMLGAGTRRTGSSDSDPEP
ncbi:MAG: hypothetical protein AB7O97_07120 [Planctomycetota bacterium]